MPRPRLTLGRLMAWIAFAGLNLAVYATVYRRIGACYGQTAAIYRQPILIGLTLFLGLLYVGGAFLHTQIRTIRAARHDPTWTGLPPGKALWLVLMVGGMIMGTGLLGVLFILLRT